MDIRNAVCDTREGLSTRQGIAAEEPTFVSKMGLMEKEF